MAKEIRNYTKISRAVRIVMGADWLRHRHQFPDKRKAGYRVKLYPAEMTDEQITEVIAIMQADYNLKVKATKGFGGYYRKVPWVAFLVPYND